jgi:hypothetical protein
MTEEQAIKERIFENCRKVVKSIQQAKSSRQSQSLASTKRSKRMQILNADIAMASSREE